MLALLKKLRDDECGFVVTSELILIMTVVCLGMVVGLTEVSSAVTRELVDVANAYNHLNQGRRSPGPGWSHQNASLIEVTGRGPVAEGS